MVLPVIHALHRRHPGAQLRVLTHQPGDVLLQHDPAVTAVVLAERGRERAAVLAELDRWRPDLVVTTTRYDGIADAIEELAPQSVTEPVAQPAAGRAGQRPLPADPRERARDRRARRRPGRPTSCSPTPSASRASRCSATKAGRSSSCRRREWRSSSGRTGGSWRRRWPAARSSPVNRRCSRVARRPGPAAAAAAAARSCGRVRRGRPAGRGGRRRRHRPDAVGRGRRGAHRRDLRPDRGRPVRPGPAGRRPAGPARLPAPPPYRDHRAGVLVGGRTARSRRPVPPAWPT